MIEEGMRSLKTSTQERQTAVQQLLSNVDISAKDTDTAFLIELVGGIFGLFGLGYIYAGLTNTGIFRLVAYIVSALIVGTLFFACVVPLTLGFGACLAPLLIIPQIALAWFSANDLKAAMNVVKAGGGSMSMPSAYIESPSPMSTSSSDSDSLFNNPTPPSASSSSSENLFNNPTPPSTSSSSSESLFTNPTPPATPPASSDDDFSADDLTTKV